jgi:hypothetical protein
VRPSVSHLKDTTSCMRAITNLLSPTVAPRALLEELLADTLDRAPCRFVSDRQRMCLEGERDVDHFHDESELPTLQKVC